MKLVTSLWTKKTKRKWHSKFNDQIKCSLYSWITYHPHFFQSPISNDCFKVMFDDQTEPQLVPKFLLRVSVRELHNSLVSGSNDGVLKDARYKYDNIIVSDSTLRSLFPPQLKHISACCNIMCGCECFVSDKLIHSSLLSRRDRYLKN